MEEDDVRGLLRRRRGEDEERRGRERRQNSRGPPSRLVLHGTLLASFHDARIV
jgi:hypothetical protein